MYTMEINLKTVQVLFENCYAGSNTYAYVYKWSAYRVGRNHKGRHLRRYCQDKQTEYMLAYHTPIYRQIVSSLLLLCFTLQSNKMRADHCAASQLRQPAAHFTFIRKTFNRVMTLVCRQGQLLHRIPL